MRKDSLSEWIDRRLQDAPMQDVLKAYVADVLDRMRLGGDHDLSTDSVVLTYARAVQHGDFKRFQQVGDWTLWVSSFAPQGVTEPELVHELGMRAYDACDRIMLRRWPVYSTLALTLPNVALVVRRHVFADHLATT